MTDHAVAHFHNSPGKSVIKVGAREFMCMGACHPTTIPMCSLTWDRRGKLSVPIARRSIAMTASLPHARPIRPNAPTALRPDNITL